jgi:hypothetical protein
MWQKEKTQDEVLKNISEHAVNFHNMRAVKAIRTSFQVASSPSLFLFIKDGLLAIASA